MRDTAQTLELIDRPRLNDKFRQGMSRQLTLVQAPLGFGKTTVIRRWIEMLQDAGLQSTYLSFELAGEDAEDMFRAALAGLCRDAGGRGAGPARDGTRDIVGQVETVQSRVFLILDDFHDATPDCTALIQKLIRLGSDKLHIVIGTREAPQFPLTKLRMAGQINDFRLEDMRFTDAEAGALLKGDVHQGVLRKAEGWVAALHLMRQSGPTAAEPGTMPHREFVEYLKEQYFLQLDPMDQNLLLATAHLDQVAPDLANVLTGQSDGWHALGQLAARHALIEERAGPDAPTYRYHQLLRDFLMKEQRTLGAERCMNLRLATSRWLAERGKVHAAMHHAKSAGQDEIAAQVLLDAGGVQFAFTQGAARLRACLSILPKTLIYERPRLLVAQAYLLLKSNRVRDGAGILQELRGRSDLRDPLLEREIILVEAHLRIYEDIPLSASQLDALEYTCRSAPSSDPMMRGLLNNFLCMFLIEQGDLTKARQVGQVAMDAFVDLETMHLQFFMHLHLSAIDLELGALDSARAHRKAARQICETEFSFDAAMRAHAEIYWGELAFELGETGGLQSWLNSQLAQIDRQEGWNMLYLAGYETCLALILFENRFDAAVDLLEHAGHVMADRGAKLFSNQLRIMELDLALRAGVREEADRLALELEDILARKSGETLRWRGALRAELALTRHAAANGKFDTAIARCSAVLAKCEAGGYRRLRDRCLMQRVILFAATEDRAQAMAALRAYVTSASQTGSYGAALREGLASAQAINWTISQNGLARFEPAEVRYISECLWHLSGRKNGQSADVFMEILTEKERDVLAELAKGHSNKVIARALDVSEPTVKFHLQNIYRKLGVSARKLAIEIAHQHGMPAA
ncbi:Nitrate/nitrite response regulator protein [Candidatus Rhodobacter oscarellae]|uniref:Nitrate/nitrite response regulator protein n=1 Tax=Candidatus Rhodobacter oscarellae TaxID=1675527 RepID=A0A0J9H3M1_9RHOB|nr:LuxR C-terminal-related transcriptional regulator [Candidatus Rhodobacter lobularis]KMW60273.1 Nitrate/nitrite response regulator protein [Candidatus Rhodobacter lobularis]